MALQLKPMPARQRADPKSHRENLPPPMPATSRASVGFTRLPFPRLKNDRGKPTDASRKESICSAINEAALVETRTEFDNRPQLASAAGKPETSQQSTRSRKPETKPSFDTGFGRATIDSLGEAGFGSDEETRVRVSNLLCRTGDSQRFQLTAVSCPPPGPSKTVLMSVLRWMNENQNRYGQDHPSCVGDPHPRQPCPKNSVDFIIKMVERTALKERMTFLAIELFFLAQRTPELSHYEPTLLALTSIWIAAKFEDAWAPHVNRFFKLESVAELKPKMVAAEALILNALCFNVNVVLVYDYFVLFSAIGRLPRQAVVCGVAALAALSSLEDHHCCDKQLLGLALAMIASRRFGLEPFWKEKATSGGRRLIGLVVQGGLTRAEFSDATRLKEATGLGADTKTDLMFDRNDLEEMLARLEPAFERRERRPATARNGIETERFSH